MFQFCEVCFRRPKSVGALLLSTCRHIFCRQCASCLTQCPICQQPCRTVEIRPETIPSDLKDYFIPAEKLLAKPLKVAKFQQEKQEAYITGRIGILEKYEAKKKSIGKLKEHYDELVTVIKQEEALIRKLREQRKSPGVLAASPASPVLMRNQVDSLRLAGQVSRTPIEQQQHQRQRGSGGGNRWDTLLSQSSNASSVCSSSGSAAPARRPSVSPIETFKKPADLVSAAKAGIYEQTVRNIDRAMRRSTETVVKVNRRANDIERARNVLF